MVRLIMGDNGAGKTKQLIELVHASMSAPGSMQTTQPPSSATEA